ncbi:MAG: SurA N-terminal domain-containing protein [Holosporaceae bacterium]|nr:SurA N-terminal domain-containing protein [Holosporaceae bacterium]
MLEFIRRHSQSIVAKTLLIILALTFVLFFGITDVIRRFIGKDYVVKIGNVKISPLELKIEKARRVSMLQEHMQNMNDKDLTAVILHQLILENIVNQAADEYGIFVSDETIKNYIRGMNMFRNKDGSFNAHLLRGFLQRIHVPEAIFLESSKKDIKNMLIKFPFAYISTTPEFYLYMRVKQEKRNLFFVKLKPSSFKITEKPTRETLEEFYKNNPDLFTAEETRSFRILELRESFWEKSIQVSEDEIKEAYDRSTENDERPYEEMKAELESTLKQEKIQSAINDVMRQIEDALVGDDVNDVVKKYNLNVISVENMNASGKDAKSTVTKLSYKDDVRVVAFSVDEGIDSSFSEAEDAQKNKVYWLLHMDKITPKHVVAYEESAAKVLSEWQTWRQREKAMGIAADLIAKAKEGNSLGKLAAARGLDSHITIAFDRSGQLPKGNVLKYEDIITAVHEDAFKLEKTEANYKEIGEDIVVYQVKDIISSTKIDPEDENTCRLELQSEIVDDMHQQLMDYLSKKYNVKINTEQLRGIDKDSNQNSLEI